MNYRTHNTNNGFPINTNGTHLQGYVKTPYDKLIKAFGEPTSGDDYKTDAEWEIVFKDGEVATIYNWKNGKNYCGANGLNVEDIKEWHIGGNNKTVVDRIKDILWLHE